MRAVWKVTHTQNNNYDGGDDDTKGCYNTYVVMEEELLLLPLHC